MIGPVPHTATASTMTRILSTIAGPHRSNRIAAAPRWAIASTAGASGEAGDFGGEYSECSAGVV